MKPEVEGALVEYLLALADDEMILAHRNSEWTGHGPILEEDIAFTNLALDEMGHALLWYQVLSNLLGEDKETYPDRLVFTREAEEFRNIQMVELPNQDWGFSMLRQYLFDEAERVRLEGLSQSTHRHLAAAARKIQLEERYHLRHTRAWMKRLGGGTQESHEIMQRALSSLWGYSLQMFQPVEGEPSLVDNGIVPSSEQVLEEWEGSTVDFLNSCSLSVPEAQGEVRHNRQDHTTHLEDLLQEMQSVARGDPEAAW